MTQKVVRNSKAWIGLSLIFPVLYIVLGGTGALIFHLNDDQAVIYITKQGHFLTPYTHSIFGWLLMSFYSLKKDFFWYDLFIVIGYCAGISRLLFLFSKYRKLSYPVAVLLLSCILLGFIPFQPHYTFLSLLLSAVAVFPYFTRDTEKVFCFSWGNWALSFFFLFVACLYRGGAAFLIIVCALGIHVLLAACEIIKKCPESSLKNFWRRSGMLLGMACFTLFMQLVNIYSFKLFPEYGRFLEYDKYRRDFSNFKKYEYDPSWKSLGISENDYKLMMRDVGIDSPPLHLENLRRLPSLRVGNTERMRNSLRQVGGSLRMSFSLLLLAVLFCGSLISRQVLVISGVCLSLIVAIAMYTGKMRLNVCLPILALGTITSIFLLWSDLQNGNPRRKKVIYSLCLLICFSALWTTIRYQYWKLNLGMKRIDSVAPISEFIAKNNIRSVAFWHGAIPIGGGEGKRLFVSGRGKWLGININHINYIGGWTGSLPQELRKLRAIYGQDIYGGLAKPGTYHLFSRRRKELFEVLVEEYGLPNIEPRVLLQTKDTVLYQIVDRNPTSE